MPRSQLILYNCTNSVKRRMDVDDHQGLIKVLNKKNYSLDSVVLVAFGRRSVISTHPAGHASVGLPTKAPVSMEALVGLGLYLIPSTGVSLKNVRIHGGNVQVRQERSAVGRII